MSVETAQPLLFDRVVLKRHALHTVPISLRQAQQFIKVHHRHNRPPRGCKVCVGIQSDLHITLIGVLVIGRPIARAYQDGVTAEVTRTCVIDCKNANSFCYGVARKIVRLLGYRRLITYTREGESGTSLKAAGFKMIATRPPRQNWANSSVKLRGLRNADEEENVTRYLWEVLL